MEDGSSTYLTSSVENIGTVAHDYLFPLDKKLQMCQRVRADAAITILYVQHRLL